MLFEALTGTPPCVGESALSTMMQHQIGKTPTLKEASMGLEFPSDLEKIVAKMLDKNPSKRYQNLGIVAHHLAALKRQVDNTAGHAESASSDRRENVHQKKTDKLLAVGAARNGQERISALDSDLDCESDSKISHNSVVLPMPKLIALASAIAVISALVAGLVGYTVGRAQLSAFGRTQLTAKGDAFKANPVSSEKSTSDVPKV